MRNSSIVLVSYALSAGIVGLSVRSANADVILQQRCSQDSLSPAEAEQRLEWARKCALTLHTNGPNDSVPTGELDANGIELRDYADDKFSYRSYTGDEIYINTTFRHWLYSALGKTTQITDPLGFFKWTKPTKRLRPYYPTFGDIENINVAQQLKPNANLSTCNLYYSNLTVASSFYVNGFCESSCYTPDQEVLFPDGYQRIDDAANTLRPAMITLDPESTLEDLHFMTNGVYSYTVEIRDADHVIFEIRTEAGGSLRVTEQHPIILGTGRLVQAQSLRVGDDLVQEDGSLDSIASIEKVDFHGKVYNIKPQTTDPVTNVLVAQGYLVGSARFQNDDIGYINRMLLGRGIPEEIIPE